MHFLVYLSVVNMAVKYIVFGVAFVGVLATTTSTTPNTNKGSDTTTDPPLKKDEPKCTDTELKQINATNIKMTQCFDSLVLHKVVDKNINCTSMTMWTDYKKPVVESLQCLHLNQTQLEKAFNLTAAVIKFIFEESTKPNFIDLLNKTKTCVNKTATEISNCLKVSLGVKNGTYHSPDFPWLMYALTDPNIISGCDNAFKLQTCILQHFNNKSEHCPPETNKFVKSVFDIVDKQQQCKRNDTAPVSPLTADNLSTAQVVSISLGVVVGTVAVAAAGIFCYKKSING